MSASRARRRRAVNVTSAARRRRPWWRREVRADTLIDAPLERVWDLLIDLASYPSWNRFMPKVSGDLRPGGILRVEVRFRRGFLGLPFRFQAQVLRCDECREIRWGGKFFFRRLLSGVHSLALDASPAGVRLVHREELFGLLVPVVGWYLAPRMEEGFREMNEAISEQVPAGS